MKNFKEIWKEISNNRTNTNLDHCIYIMLKALNAKAVKSNEISAKDLALILLSKHYTPVTNKVKIENGMHKWLGILHNAGLVRTNFKKLPINEFLAKYSSKMFSCFETQEEYDEFRVLFDIIMKEVRNKNVPENEYVYIFVRDDISKEQQVVQSSHVALVLGNQLRDKKVDELYFVLCHAKSEEELALIKNHFIANGVNVVHFIEPDMNHSLTAIASHPVKKSDRHFAKQFPLLTYKTVDTIEPVV